MIKTYFKTLVIWLLIIEICCKTILFLPMFNELLEGYTSSSKNRIRWVKRYLHSRFQNPINKSIDRYDPRLGWSLKPGLNNHLYGLNCQVSSNSQGIRGTQKFSKTKPSEKKRIILLGDSFMFGDEVNDEETIGFYLQKLLGEQFEVMNFAIHGYAHDQMLLRLKAEGLSYQPDLVILGFVSWDMYRNLFDFNDYSKPRYILKNNTLKLVNAPVIPPPYMIALESFRWHTRDVIQFIADAVFERNGHYTKLSRALTVNILEEMRKAVRQNGAELMVVYLPIKQEMMLPPVENSNEFFIRNLSRQLEIPFINSRPFLAQGLKDGREYQFKEYGHYGPLIHQAIASLIYAQLKEKRRISAGP